GKEGPYHLFVDVLPWAKGRESEPNDDPDHAEDMAMQEAGQKELEHRTVFGWWSREDDSDCFKVPLNVPATGAVLRLELQAPKGVWARVGVMDSGDENAKIARKQMAEAFATKEGEKAIIPALGMRSWEAGYIACTQAVKGSTNFAERYTLDVITSAPT